MGKCKMLITIGEFNITFFLLLLGFCLPCFLFVPSFPALLAQLNGYKVEAQKKKSPEMGMHIERANEGNLRGKKKKKRKKVRN